MYLKNEQNYCLIINSNHDIGLCLYEYLFDCLILHVLVVTDIILLVVTDFILLVVTDIRLLLTEEDPAGDVGGFRGHAHIGGGTQDLVHLVEVDLIRVPAASARDGAVQVRATVQVQVTTAPRGGRVRGRGEGGGVGGGGGLGRVASVVNHGGARGL